MSTPQSRFDVALQDLSPQPCNLARPDPPTKKFFKDLDDIYSPNKGYPNLPSLIL